MDPFDLTAEAVRNVQDQGPIYRVYLCTLISYRLPDIALKVYPYASPSMYEVGDPFPGNATDQQN